MTIRSITKTSHGRIPKIVVLAIALLVAVSPLAAQMISPPSVNITNGVPPNCGQFPVSITLPAVAVNTQVDVFFLFDDTASFEDVSRSVTNIFSGLVTSLETELPGVSLGFGVGRFEDYGGAGNGFSSQGSVGRPFTLNQPIVTAVTAGSAAARDALIAAALLRTGPGLGGDSPESAIEGLFQVATGAGFDGNGNSSLLDSGVAGAAATQTTPGTSGDVPPFSSNTLPASGNIGGVGWRADAQRIVILATDICPVSPFTAGSPIPGLITGTGTSSEPTTAFACVSTTPGSSRFGYVSDSKVKTTNTVVGAVAPKGAATVQGTVNALNALGIKVLGMARTGIPTTAPGPSVVENVWLSAIARLTGAIDGSGNPLVFNIGAIEFGDTSVQGEMLRAITTTTRRPVDISLNTSSLPSGLLFSFSPSVVSGVSPGGTASFNVNLNASGSSVNGSFNVNFIDAANQLVLGSVPVALSCSPATGSIAGTVFVDANSNGVRDTGEDGLPGVTVTMSGTSSGPMISAADGSFSLNPASAGNYTASVPATVGNLVLSTVGSRSFSLVNDEHKTGVDFGFKPLNADLAVTKTDGTATITAGDGVTYTYTITVTNAGPSPAADVTVNDTWPAGFTRGAITTSQGTCSNPGGNFTCSLGALANGGSATVTVGFTVPSTATPGPVTNTAAVTSSTPDSNATNNSASDTDTVVASADLSVTKTDGVATVTAGDGDTYTYIITVANAGPSQAADVTLTDVWPAGFTKGTVTTSQGSCTSVTPPNLSCSLGALATGAAATVKIKFTVPSTLAAGPQTNTATVASSTPDGNAANNSASDTDTVVVNANLSVTKTDGVNTITAGDGVTYTYTITVTNAGPSQASDVTVTDVWPSSGFTQGTIVPSQGSCTSAVPPNFSCNLGGLADGAAATVKVTFTVPSTTAAGPRTNTATVTSSTPDSNATNNSASDTDTVVANADLSVTKTDGVATVTAGDGVTYTYTITVNNAGPSQASNVALNDTWPAGFTQGTISSSQGSCSSSTAPNFSCSLGTLANGGSATVTALFTVPSTTAAGSRTNTATATSTTPDSHGNNNSASDTDTVVASADLSVTKTDGVSTMTAGDGVTYTYTITVTNAGPSQASNVTLNDTWPAGFTQGAISSSQGSCSNTNKAPNFACSLGTLTNGGSATVTALFTVPSTTAAGPRTNTATVDSSTADSNATNNSASDTDTVVASADLSVTKTDGVATVTAGDGVTYTYTITVANAGPSQAADATLTDVWPAGFTKGTVTASQGTCTSVTPPNFSCSLGGLATGAAATVKVAFTVPSTTAAGPRTNTATVTSSTPDGNAANNSASDTDTVVVNADLSVTKTDGVATVTAGDGVTYTYTITVTNAGPSQASDVSMTDAWPGGFTQGTIVPSQGSCTSAPNFSCNLGGLANGAAATVKVAFTVPSTTAAGPRTNTATVTSSTPDSNATNNSASDTDTVAANADLSVAKTDGVTTVNPGDGITYTYTMTVTNNGPSQASDVTLSDLWPRAFARGTVTSSQGSCASPAAPDFTCSLGALANGATATVRATFTVPAGTLGGTFTNTATVASNTPDRNSSNNTASDVDVIGCSGVIGDLVWSDWNLDGLQAGELSAGINGVIVRLSGGPSVRPPVTTATFNGNPGSYRFTGLCAGTYTVEVDQTSAPLAGMVLTSTQVGSDRSVDGNGSPAIVTVIGGTDQTVDFGFVHKCAACAGSTGAPNAGGLTWNVDGNGDVYVQYDQNTAINDNSYGTTAVGWGNKAHTFNDLAGSDKAQFLVTDGTGKKVLDFYLDYLSKQPGSPSGYGSLGAFGGEGDVKLGNAAACGTGKTPGVNPACLLDWSTSLDENLNDLNYCSNGSCSGGILSTSPATASSTSYSMINTAGFPKGWNFVSSYKMKISHLAFGASGFGGVTVGQVQNSPAKTGSNTITPGCGCGGTTPSLTGGTCDLGYPFQSANPLTSVAFNESEVLRAVVGGGGTIRAYYGDEHALLLGVRTASQPVTPLDANPGRATNPFVGDTSAMDPSGRPFYPSLFITDITADPTSKAGDWQSSGSPIKPNDIFGTWKGAARTTVKNVTSITTDANPASNSENLGAGSDAPPAGILTEGYSAELRWNVGDLALGGQPLQPGHTYRMQVMVHDGDQNKTGGDVGQACVNVSIPGETVQQTALLTIVKTTNDVDHNSAPGAMVTAGDQMRWGYSVTNGPVALTSVAVTDADGGAVTCPSTTLAPYEFMTCMDKNWTAAAGQHAGLATVTAMPSTGGQPVSASDPEHYFGQAVQCSGTIGNFVWTDWNLDGLQTGEMAAGINGVTVRLSGGPTSRPPVTTASQGGQAGFYQFTGLCAGTYTVDVDMASTPLTGMKLTSTLVGADRTIDSNSNGTTVAVTSGDQTVDFGFVHYCARCTGPAGLPGAGALTWNVDGQGDVYVQYEQNRSLNDNSYGTGSVGWGANAPSGKNHDFGKLADSDKAEFIFTSGNGATVLDFVLDYLSPKPGTASGYGSLGAFGGNGGRVFMGNTACGTGTAPASNPACLIAWTTSLDDNLNTLGYCSGGTCSNNLLTNSPATESATSYTLATPASFPKGWNFTNSYRMKISRLAFGSAGFGGVTVGRVTNYQAKVGSGDITPGCGCGSLGSVCELGYPFSSANPLTSVAFNESEVLRGMTADTRTIRAFYSDEHALLLGVRTSSRAVTPLQSSPGSFIDPLVGDTTATDPSGRPFFPSLFITDITSDESSRVGDWQFNGSPVKPHEVYGTWKGASRSGTGNVITTDSDPAKNDWDLGAGRVPPADIASENSDGYGAEVLWNINQLLAGGQPLQSGRTYRMQVMVHDGDQNKLGGDVGQACMNVTIP